ncbi:hypothetical protein [Streptomyces mirabilis]|uniref:hypothetical protein n=1 Tax=Streptomyces mirabilis TaxID=68239 RepID=UPI003695CA35
MATMKGKPSQVNVSRFITWLPVSSCPRCGLTSPDTRLNALTGRDPDGPGFVAQVIERKENPGPTALLPYWLMDGSPAQCRPGCPSYRARPALFAAIRLVGRVAAARTVMVTVSALVVLPALGAVLSAAG